MKLWKTHVEIEGKPKESFLAENKFEAVVIGIRALFRILEGSKFLQDIEFIPSLVADLWKDNEIVMRIGTIKLEEVDG